MAALRCFSNYGKSLAGQSKASHFGETYRDMRHIIIKKVPHRVKQFTTRKTSYESSADVQRWLREQGYEDEEQQSSQSSQNGQNAPAFNPTLLASRRDAPWILSSLSPFYDQHLIMDVLHEAHSGKEATVYCCEAHPSTGPETFPGSVKVPLQLARRGTIGGHGSKCQWLGNLS